MLNKLKAWWSLVTKGKVVLVFTNGQVYHLRKGDKYFYNSEWCNLKIARVNP